MTSGLIAIGEALKTYALAEADGRDKLRVKVRADAARVIAELDHARRRE